MPQAKTFAMTLRLPEETRKKLEIPIRKGRSVTITDIVRRALDEYIERHQEFFS